MLKIRYTVISAILIFISLVLVCALAWAFWQVRTIFIYILVAAIIAMITRPLERKMRKWKIGKRAFPAGLRALIVLLVVYVVIFAFGIRFVRLFADEATAISKVDPQQLATALHDPITQIENAFSGFQQSSANHQSLEEYVQATASSLLNTTKVSSIANSLFSIFGAAFIAFFAISFFTFFFIKDGPRILEMLLLLVPVKRVKSVENIIGDSQTMLRKYFTGVLIDVLFVSTFISIGMAILGVQNALIIGFFAGVMNIIPYVGPLIGGSFAIVICVASNLTVDFSTVLVPMLEKIVVVFVIMNLLDAFIVQPFIFSNRVKAHPIEIFTVILVAGTLAGVGGMIVAVPVYTICRIIAREFFSKYRFVQRLTNELEEAADPNHAHHSKPE